jgi:hypothetical protein
MNKGQVKMKYRDRDARRFVRWGRFFTMVLAFLLMIAALVYVYHDKAVPLKTFVMDEVQKVKTWVAERKQKRLMAAKLKTKGEVTEEQDSTEDVHFEFYTALPSMRVNTEVPAEPVKVATAPETKEAKKPASIKHIFASSEELEKEFSARINKKSKPLKNMTN